MGYSDDDIDTIFDGAPLLIGILIRLMLVNLINRYDRLPFKHEYNG